MEQQAALTSPGRAGLLERGHPARKEARELGCGVVGWPGRRGRRGRSRGDGGRARRPSAGSAAAAGPSIRDDACALDDGAVVCLRLLEALAG